jgi:hypothetical protein
MCHSNAPLQTKSDMEIQEDFGEDAANDADTENLFTCATQVRKENTLLFLDFIYMHIS